MYSFAKIPQYTCWAQYTVNVYVSWTYLEEHLRRHVKDMKLNLDPDFQRAHIWTEAQQVRYVEFCLRGGHSAQELLLNCRGWNKTAANLGEYILVDGKQRLEAVRKFMRNELEIFADGLLGNHRPLRLKNFQEKGPSLAHCSFRWSVNDLGTRAEVLQWYLDINAGGVVHTDAEIERVKHLLRQERER